jgi:hypothetical protein
MVSCEGHFPSACNTCMNVIVDRRRLSDGGGYVLNKFSLYYPDSNAAAARWGECWPLLQGYAFRTAVFTGTRNQSILDDLQSNTVDGFNADDHGLVSDDQSKYEDCAYMKVKDGETDVDRIQRIETMIDAMENAEGTQGSLAMSYDPEQAKGGMTALRSEWDLMKRMIEHDHLV